MVSTAMWLATSPALRPPMPSQTTNRPRSGAATRWSSLCWRLSPTSVNAACAISTGAFLSRQGLQTGAQILGHLGAALIAAAGVFLQGAIDDRLAQPGHVRPDGRQRRVGLIRD